jgi:hypothetical protein
MNNTATQWEDIFRLSDEKNFDVSPYILQGYSPDQIKQVVENYIPARSMPSALAAGVGRGVTGIAQGLTGLGEAVGLPLHGVSETLKGVQQKLAPSEESSLPAKVAGSIGSMLPYVVGAALLPEVGAAEGVAGAAMRALPTATTFGALNTGQYYDEQSPENKNLGRAALAGGASGALLALPVGRALGKTVDNKLVNSVIDKLANSKGVKQTVGQTLQNKYVGSAVKGAAEFPLVMQGLQTAGEYGVTGKANNPVDEFTKSITSGDILPDIIVGGLFGAGGQVVKQGGIKELNNRLISAKNKKKTETFVEESKNKAEAFAKENPEVTKSVPVKVSDINGQGTEVYGNEINLTDMTNKEHTYTLIPPSKNNPNWILGGKDIPVPLDLGKMFKISGKDPEEIKQKLEEYFSNSTHDLFLSLVNDFYDKNITYETRKKLGISRPIDFQYPDGTEAKGEGRYLKTGGNENPLDLYTVKTEDGKWVVVDKQSGIAFTEPANTEEEAYNNFEKYLTEQPGKTFSEKIDSLKSNLEFLNKDIATNGTGEEINQEEEITPEEETTSETTPESEADFYKNLELPEPDKEGIIEFDEMPELPTPELEAKRQALIRELEDIDAKFEDGEDIDEDIENYKERATQFYKELEALKKGNTSKEEETTPEEESSNSEVTLEDVKKNLDSFKESRDKLNRFQGNEAYLKAFDESYPNLVKEYEALTNATAILFKKH